MGAGLLHPFACRNFSLDACAAWLLNWGFLLKESMFAELRLDSNVRYLKVPSTHLLNSISVLC